MMNVMEELRAGTRLRLARALLVAAVAGGLGAWAHASAGGLLPGVGWLAFGGVVLVATANAFLARPASTRRLVALVGGGQFFTHLLLTATAGHVGDRAADAAPEQAGGGVDQDRLAALARLAESGERRQGSLYDLTMAGSDPLRGAGGSGQLVVPHWLTHIVDDLSGPHALMALAHLAAATGVACWLALGEHALWLLICCLGVAAVAVAAAFVRVPFPQPSRSLRLAVRRLRHRRRPPLPPPLLGALARRGPPATFIAA